MHSNIQFIQAAKHSSSSPYKTLAKYLSNSLPQHSVSSIQSALEYLSKSQSTLKSIDGASHEFYQLSHKNTIEGSAGRVERSAGRVGCCADSLLGCELLDWMDRMCEVGDGDDNGNGGNSPRQDKVSEKKEQEEDDAVNDDQDTMDLNDRKMVLNVNLQDPLPLRVVVLYEPYYTGGAGMNHGGIDGLANNHGLDSQQDQPARGRYLIIIKDGLEDDLEKTLECLDSTPEFFELDVGLVSGEIASVNRILWMAAQKVLEACCKCWSHDLVEKDEGKVMTDNDGNVSNGDDDATRDEMGNGHGKELDNQEDMSRKSNDLLPALHFVGRSLAGGVATLAAILVDGSIPMPPPLQERRTRVTTARGRTRSRSKSKSKSRSTRTKSSKRHARSSQSKSHETVHHSLDDASRRDLSLKLHGFGMGRASAVALGAPPSISANIKASFVTSVICGDDIVCRVTQQSMERLRQRTSRRLEGGVLMKQVGWMTDTLSLTLSSLQSHAHGSEGEEARLSIPGRVYLVRPRRYGGGVSSMHEIGRGRDALRAAVLWQLNDVLLSRSLWKHHSLESYITSIDKVGLRTIDTMDGSDAEENDMPDEIFS